jgi:hypothetical protein
MKVDDTAMSDKDKKRLLMKELVNLHETTKVSANMKDIQEIVGIPMGARQAHGGWLDDREPGRACAATQECTLLCHPS